MPNESLQGSTAAPNPKGVPGRDQVTGKSQGIADSVQVVEFLLGKEHFAVDLFDVREVVEYTRITHLPNSPSFIKGIIDLRGEITTIINLKGALTISDAESRNEEDSRIIVLDDQITTSKTGSSLICMGLK